MKAGDKFIYTDPINKTQHKLTYTGTRREIKGCMYEFFTEEGKDGCCFYDDSEVATMKSVVDIPWPKPLEEPTTTAAEAEARQKKFEDGIRYIQG